MKNKPTPKIIGKLTKPARPAPSGKYTSKGVRTKLSNQATRMFNQRSSS